MSKQRNITMTIRHSGLSYIIISGRNTTGYDKVKNTFISLLKEQFQRDSTAQFCTEVTRGSKWLILYKRTIFRQDEATAPTGLTELLTEKLLLWNHWICSKTQALPALKLLVQWESLINITGAQRVHFKNTQTIQSHKAENEDDKVVQKHNKHSTALNKLLQQNRSHINWVTIDNLFFNILVTAREVGSSMFFLALWPFLWNHAVQTLPLKLIIQGLKYISHTPAIGD